MKLVITDRARRDQDEISRYTLDRWGRAQVVNYIGGLLDRMDAIAADPAIGRRISGLPPRFMRVSYRSHFIFYVLRGDAVRIVRILHQRMDAARHLNRSL